MEIIELQGYTEEEKVHIAFRYLIPRQIKENGIAAGATLSSRRRRFGYIVRHYTREAGVRKLEQVIGTVCRKQARRIAEGNDREAGRRQGDHAGVPGRHQGARRHGDRRAHQARPGVAVGLAWTPAGGDILFIEANRMKGKGGFTMTGQIGEVMQESMQAALTWVRSNATTLGLEEDFTQGHRPAHSRAGRRDSQGWSFGGRHHGDGAGFAADRYADAIR